MGESTKSSIVRRGISRKKGILLVVAVIISIASACVGFYIFKSTPAAEKTLVFVSILHRHGERAPLMSYPLDPYSGAQFWPDGLQMLIQKGKESMHNLGGFLRQRYDGFLSSTYKPTEIYVRSSNSDRCLMSVELLLAGLYPPIGKQIWKLDLPWQPIPVHTAPYRCDDMIVVHKYCPLKTQETKKSDEYIQKETDKHQELLSNISQNTGLQVKSNIDLFYIYDNLVITKEVGLPLPQWTQTINWDELESLMDLGDYKTPVGLWLYSGVLLNDIVSNMKKKLGNSNSFERRLSLYSGHDGTVLFLWKLMNISQELTKEPDYAAALIIELHEINSIYKVKILYKSGSSSESLEVLKIRGCEKDGEEDDEMCNFDTFYSALQPACITDFDEACRIP